MQISIGEGELNGAAFCLPILNAGDRRTSYETFLGEYMKMFCRLTKFAFSNRAHSPPHLSNISIRSSLSFEERTHNKIGRIAGAVIPRIGYLVAIPSTLRLEKRFLFPHSPDEKSLADYIVKPRSAFLTQIG
jgi:hypothetical protein